MTGATGPEIIIDGNTLVAENYRKNGSCDCSYAVLGVARFRVNIYSRGGHGRLSYANSQCDPTNFKISKCPRSLTRSSMKMPAVFITGIPAR